MSTLHLVRCEQHENCKQEYSFGSNCIASDFAPEAWITLFDGKLRGNEGWHFCSKECLFDWMMERWEISGGFKRQEAQGQLECKARRFLLVDGETADITEGVKWLNGSVALETEIPVNGFNNSSEFRDWDKFKAANEGSGVQWIDKEVKASE